jgi:hypothetical protein
MLNDRETGNPPNVLHGGRTIMTAPQTSTMLAMNSRGPTLRMMTVAGIWKMVYVMKNNRDVML